MNVEKLLQSEVKSDVLIAIELLKQYSESALYRLFTEYHDKNHNKSCVYKCIRLKKEFFSTSDRIVFQRGRYYIFMFGDHIFLDREQEFIDSNYLLSNIPVIYEIQKDRETNK